MPIAPFTAGDNPVNALPDPGPGPVINAPGGSQDPLQFESGGLGLHMPVTTGFTPAVPEPSTWAMMLIGFVGLACTSRRRRNRRPA